MKKYYQSIIGYNFIKFHQIFKISILFKKLKINIKF